MIVIITIVIVIIIMAIIIIVIMIVAIIIVQIIMVIKKDTKIWNMKATVTPVVIGALGATPKKLKKILQDFGIDTKIVDL